MQIIIPMSGFGERFRRAGYTVPKPLIPVHGKPIIAHVIDLFPGETNMIFICNEDHLNTPSYRMREQILQYCPTAKIVSVKAHKKGPVHATLLAGSVIDKTEPTIVNYCDFSCLWHYDDFCKTVLSSECDGAIPAYKGFHPHTLGSTHYAYMREKEGQILDIQEKQPFTDNRMEEYASSGTYYFKSGAMMLEAFKETIAQDLHVNHEYYVSLAYKPLLQQKKNITVYPLAHFMQWGTPEDLQEYEGWASIFAKLEKRNAKQQALPGTLLLPMGGLGKRFADEGYQLTKPLIPVHGKPMAVQALNDLPAHQEQIIVMRQDMPAVDTIQKTLKQAYPASSICMLNSLTDGQASTVEMGIKEYEQQHGKLPAGPVTIGACDNGAIYDFEQLKNLLNDPGVDVIVWVARGHANAKRHPEMFGWVKEHQGVVEHISVKKPLESPRHDPIVIGTFTFKSPQALLGAIASMKERQALVNGEYYMDMCINDAIAQGLRCVIFEVEHFVSWGTPNDLKTFEYWDSCFHQWHTHAYIRDCEQTVAQA